MAKRKILKTSGYPTTDDKSFDTHKAAMIHQTDIDLDESCEGGSVESAVLKAYLKDNVEVVQEYIKHHLTPKKKPTAAQKKAAEKKAAEKKTATSEAAK